MLTSVLHLIMGKRLVPTSLVIILLGSFSVATAEDGTPQPNPTNEPAITYAPDDEELDWGPCPDFMPASCRIAVLQGDPEAPNADVFFRMAPDTTIPRHWHHSAERMVLVSGEMHVDYDGQEPVILRPGHYAYGPAEKPHTTYCAEGEACILFIAFEKPVDAIPE